MSWLRNKLRRWLGVPTAEQVRQIALREIDADAVWRGAEHPDATRYFAITSGKREDTRYVR